MEIHIYARMLCAKREKQKKNGKIDGGYVVKSARMTGRQSPNRHVDTIRKTEFTRHIIDGNMQILLYNVFT